MVRFGIMRTPRRVKLPVRTLWVISLVAAMWGLGGCHGGSLWGAGIGALFGQAIGGNTESTVAGAAIGALIGADASHGYHSGYYYSHQAHYGHHHYGCDHY